MSHHIWEVEKCDDTSSCPVDNSYGEVQTEQPYTAYHSLQVHSGLSSPVTRVQSMCLVSSLCWKKHELMWQAWAHHPLVLALHFHQLAAVVPLWLQQAPMLAHLYHSWEVGSMWLCSCDFLVITCTVGASLSGLSCVKSPWITMLKPSSCWCCLLEIDAATFSSTNKWTCQLIEALSRDSSNIWLYKYHLCCALRGMVLLPWQVSYLSTLAPSGHLHSSMCLKRQKQLLPLGLKRTQSSLCAQMEGVLISCS